MPSPSSPASPSSMMRDDGADELRYELKLPLFDRRLDAVQGAIRMHPAGFREVHHARMVNNLYFDTPGLDLYFQSLSGVSRRYKFRLRWYGTEEAPTDAAIAQWKWRDNALGYKESRDVVRPFSWVDPDWKAVHGRLLEGMTGQARARFSALLWPTVLNRYRRRYFVSRLTGVRLTLDDQLELSALPGLARQVRPPALRYHRFMVVELKAPATHRRQLASAVEGFSTRPARYSKYASAIRYLTGSLDA